MPKVEVILVKYNQPRLEAETTRHVLETVGEDFSYSLTVHQNAPGVGLAKCWNELIARSKAEYICLLNTDTIPAPGWLEKLCKKLDEHEDIAAVVPASNRVHLSQVNENDFRYPVVRSPRHAGYRQFELENSTGWGEWQNLPTCSAMCVVFRRHAWVMANTLHGLSDTPAPQRWMNDQGFDEDFRFYGEDTEFFYRVRAIGLGRIVWVRDVYVHHIGQQSFKKAMGGEEYSVLRNEAAYMWLKKKGEIDARYPERALPL